MMATQFNRIPNGMDQITLSVLQTGAEVYTSAPVCVKLYLDEYVYNSQIPVCTVYHFIRLGLNIRR